MVANAVACTDGPDFTFVTSAARGAPRLVAVKLAPSSFTAARGSKLEVKLSQASRVTVQIMQTLAGHKQHKRCSTSAKHGERCTIHRPRGSRSFRGAIGSDTFKFKATGLAAGTYLAKVVATNPAGRASRAVTIKFTVKATKKEKEEVTPRPHGATQHRNSLTASITEAAEFAGVSRPGELLPSCRGHPSATIC